MKVGFIGLGHRGAGVAANLLKSGHKVTVYNRSRAKAEALIAREAKEAATIADACRGDGGDRLDWSVIGALAARDAGVGAPVL